MEGGPLILPDAVYDDLAACARLWPRVRRRAGRAPCAVPAHYGLYEYRAYAYKRPAVSEPVRPAPSKDFELDGTITCDDCGAAISESEHA